MIVTRKKEIPFYWILLAVTPWAASFFAAITMGTAFLFSLKKLVENPAEITFILTLPSYISIFLWPLCSFLSDRIWTPFGRRKPFILVSWIGMMMSVVLLPFMQSLWSLVLCFMVFSLSSDLNAPVEPLKQEIVPPHQRGKSTGVMAWMNNLAGLTFSFVAIGRFDDIRFMGGKLVSGETLIYWSAGLMLLVTFLLLLLGIKEINPKSPLLGQKLSVKAIFFGILDRDLWPVYTLIFGTAMLRAGLGPLGNLLYTDQWNYTKQDMGDNIAVGSTINIFVIGGLTLIADRLNRMRAYQILIILALIVQVFYYLYIEFVLPDRHPSLVEIIFFGETLSIIGILTGMVYVPLVYDYVIRDKMGAYAAGAGLVTKFTQIITLNLIGLFVWGYAIIFQPPSGDMVRVCLKDDLSSAQVRSILQENSWHYPDEGRTARGADVSATAWYSNGIVSNIGPCWEVRLRDTASGELAAARENLQNELTSAGAGESILRDQAEIEFRRNQPEDAHRDLQKAAAKKILVDEAQTKLTLLESKLKSRTDDFRQQVTGALGSYLLPDGEQVVAARVQDALIVEMAVAQRPTSALEKVLVDLRRQGLKVIDLRPAKQAGGYNVVVSALIDPGVDEESLAQKLAETTARISAKGEPNLFTSPVQIVGRRHQQAVVMDIKVVEEPLDSRISPITRVVNAVLTFFGSGPQPERRLAATARSLRLNGETEHVGIEPGREKGNVISVVALLLPGAAKAQGNDSITIRLQSLCGPGATSNTIAQTRAFYDRLVAAAAVERITIEQPVLTASFANMKYDYMSGYIPIFLLSGVGLSITFAFARREKKGLIRKLGVEEANAS